MNRMRRILSVVLAVLLLQGMFAGLHVNAAITIPVNIYVQNYASGILDIRWDTVVDAKSVRITYHTPDDADEAVDEEIKQDSPTDRCTISGLKADYIYDIKVELYSEPGCGGQLLAHGFLYYLPKITFFAEAVEPVPAYTDIPGGGRESGDRPELRLRWVEPKVYNGEKFVYVTHTDENSYTKSHLAYMQAQLNSVYPDSREIDTLDYRINISSDVNKLNGGSTEAAVLIEDDENGGLIAYMSLPPDVVPTVTANVYRNESTGFYSFNIVGRKDKTVSEIPDEDPDDHRLPDYDILPGSVYYMNIKPVFRDSESNPVNVLVSGNQEDQNGSPLSGAVSYVSTPIRFQLSKDNFNNIYVKIYKINQGSLDLPRLYYQVQASDDPSVQGDWTVKKTMDDTYFNGDFAVTVITGINPNNNIYYKIVVKSESPNDRLESLKTPYMLSVDTSKPPVPMNIVVTGRELHPGTVTNPSGVEVNVKSTDVTISWEKPAGWSRDTADMVFHFMLSTSQSDLEDEVPLYVNGTYWKSYVPKFRLVKYVDSRSSSIIDEGNRLSITINAFDLFKAERWNDTTESIETVDLDNDQGNPDDYPAFLLPNTVYYLKMYTTRADYAGTTDSTRTSDQSLVVSFTTLSGVELDVPLPVNFRLEANGKNTEVAPPENYIDIQFDKVTNLDWRNYTTDYDITRYNYYIYYDIYMNSRTDTAFTLIGTTEDLEGDVAFSGVDDPASTSVRARISRFSDNSHHAVSRFGYKLLPNTTYYFTARTRLVIENKTDPADRTEKISVSTAILPVTTVVIDINPPDDNDRDPLTPVDFAIAVDSSGNQMVSSNSVTFTWERKEFDVVYELIRTAARVGPRDELSTYEYDPEYISFIEAYDVPSDGLENERVYIDPDPAANPRPGPAGKFTYDPVTKICTYTVDLRFFPNKLYYFSLRAVRLDEQKTPVAESAWASIPVTTSLIEAPIQLVAMVDAQLAFFFVDGTPGMTADDYRIFVKGPGDNTFKQVTRSVSTLVKDRDGKTYYGRITNLKTNSSYDIRVYKGIDNSVLVYEKKGLRTRDSYHELEVRWRGLPVDNYTKYELAIRAENEPEYTILTVHDLEQFVNSDGSILPYYMEESAQTVNNNHMYFSARIHSATVTLPGGLKTRQALKSNTRYYIKVRAVKADPADPGIVAYSKYAGPVDIRTEFNQEDYDNTDRENESKAIFLDRIKQLEKGYFWRVDIGNGDAVKFLLKAERVVDAINNSKEDAFVLDISQYSFNIGRDTVYVPLSVIKAINAKNKSLVIKTNNSEYTIRPRTFNTGADSDLGSLLERPSVRDIYYQIDITRADTVSGAVTPPGERLSSVNDFEIVAVGATLTDEELKKLIHDRLYEKDSGLVDEKLNLLLNAYLGKGPEAVENMEKYAEILIGMIEKELSQYIKEALQSSRLATSVKSITLFDAPVSARLAFTSRQGLKAPYVLYDGSSAWQRLSENVTETAYSLAFNVEKTGKYVVMLVKTGIADVPASHWAYEDIRRLTSKYDLSDVFAGVNDVFAPENRVTGTEIILLYEKLTGKASVNAGLDIRQKSARMGLDAIISPSAVNKNIRRQETAAVLIRLFAAKKGVSVAALRPGRTIILRDENQIDDKFYKDVILAVDLYIMTPDGSGYFNPQSYVTRAEIASALVRLLEMTGDI